MAVYFWSVLCEGKSSSYWQRTRVESETDPTGGVCSDGSLILEALRGNLVPNVPTSTVVAPGDTLTYGELLAYTGTGIKLPSGTSGQVLTSQGAGAELKWTTTGGGGGSGTVTSVATGTGLSGGPITSTGTVNFATAPDKCVLGTSTGAGPPTPIILSTGDLLTNTGSSLILPGNTTATKMFLSQTGTGVVSSVPQWSVITASDVTGVAITKTNDTNVTLTLSGSPNDAALQDINLTAGWTGALPMAQGGSGVTYISRWGDPSLEVGVGGPLLVYPYSPGVFVMRTTIGNNIQNQNLFMFLNAFPQTATDFFNYLTVSNDVNITMQSFSNGFTNIYLGFYPPGADLILGWTGTLAATRGGTGFGSYTTGQILYADSTTSLARLDIGTSGQILTVSGGLPSWQTLGLAITKTDDTNVTLTLGGSYTTAVFNAVSLQAGWSGVLTAALGGTGYSSYTVGQLLYADTTTTLAKLNIGTAGYVLTLSGGLPTWQASPTGSSAVTSITGSANQVLANGTSGSAQTGTVTLTFESDEKISTSLGVGVAATGVAGQISGARLVLTGSSYSMLCDSFVVQTSGGTRMMYVSYGLGITDIYVGYNAGNSSPGTNGRVCVGESAGTSHSGTLLTAIGYRSAYSATTATLTSVGYQAGYSFTTGSSACVGYQAGYTLTSATTPVSTAFGYQAAKMCTTSGFTMCGYRAGAEQKGDGVAMGAFAGCGAVSSDGTGCVFAGYNAGVSIGASTQQCTALGSSAGANLTNGLKSTLLGYAAGSGLTTGSGHVMIGSSAGGLETTNSNILYIANSNTSTPLIYGDFSAPSVTVNGSFAATVTVVCASTFQMTPTNVSRASSASSATPSFAALSAPYILAGQFVIASAEIVGANCSKVSFTSIPATFQHLKFIITGVSTADIAILAQWGATGAVDTGANYETQYLYGNGTSITAQENIGTSSSFITYFPNGGQSTTEVIFSNYCANTNAGSAVYRSFSAYGGCMINSAGSGFCSQSVGTNMNNTTAIGQIDFSPSSGSLAIGTKFTLYGLY